MPKNKTKDWKITTFSLDRDSLLKLEELANLEGLSKSQMVDFLITNWDSGINPNEKLKDLQNKKEILLKRLNELDKEINQTINQITLFQDWKEEKQNKKEQAIRILQGKILKKEIQDAERIAKTWQRICGVPAIELLVEAKQNIEKRGI
ncbi:MAG: hypothetical protein ACOC5T_01675 [Elusimicrobiota bacterium]